MGAFAISLDRDVVGIVWSVGREILAWKPACVNSLSDMLPRHDARPFRG